MLAPVHRRLQALDPETREMLGQLVRYALTGGFVTLCYAAVYAGLVRGLHVAPMVANLIGYAGAVALGYVLHSAWSFRGHGARERTLATTAKFVAVSLFSLALNSAWVWIIVHGLHLSNLLPLIPISIVTPLAVFWLNRAWVFA